MKPRIPKDFFAFKSLGKKALLSFTGIVFLLFYAPLLLLMVMSFNSAQHGAYWESFSLHWYESLWQKDTLLEALWHSVSLALVSSILCAFLGTLAALSLHLYKFRGQSFLRVLFLCLSMVPDIVLAIAFLVLFTSIQLPLGFITLLLAHTTFSLPFVYFTVAARLQRLDPSMLEAAMDLGASPMQAYRYVLLPLLSPAILSGALLAFTLSLDDAVISFFVTGTEYETLPVQIFSMVRLGFKPELPALATCLFALSMLSLLLAYVVRKRHVYHHGLEL